MTYSKSELTPLLREVFSEVVDILRDSVGQRLTSSRSVRNHGDRGNLYLFNVWDKEQSALLHRDHFCYCFGYYSNRLLERGDRRGNLAYFHLWINTTRLYYEQALMVSLLEQPVRDATPEPFIYDRIDRAISVGTEFPFIEDFAAFKDYIIPLYVSLISPMHPILVQVIELCRTPLTKEERRAILEQRGRPRISLSRRPHEELQLFSRYCPQGWRNEILVTHGSHCAHCGTPLTVKTAHIDHIIPWSIEPMREKSNFQPLCGPCNAKKGNRHSH
ncbi:MAG: endonuclease [Verrucomicrobiota bacterium]|jgi:5-methylcytosine-specific restriction endonuclease McrA